MIFRVISLQGGHNILLKSNKKGQYLPDLFYFYNESKNKKNTYINLQKKKLRYFREYLIKNSDTLHIYSR